MESSVRDMSDPIVLCVPVASLSAVRTKSFMLTTLNSNDIWLVLGEVSAQN